MNNEKLRIKFNWFTMCWKRDIKYCSSMTVITSHPAYQEIIDMGEDVLVFIFQDMLIKPNHWFVALRAITGKVIIPAEYAGDLNKMTELWLDWAKEHNYL